MSEQAEPEDGPAMPKGMDWRAFTPEDSPKTPIEVMAEPKHRELSTPNLAEGDPAFAFVRPLYDYSGGTKVETGRRFDLLEAAREKPVALIFGSYT